jgi:hypothetical protein
MSSWFNDSRPQEPQQEDFHRDCRLLRPGDSFIVIWQKSNLSGEQQHCWQQEHGDPHYEKEEKTHEAAVMVTDQKVVQWEGEQLPSVIVLLLR